MIGAKQFAGITFIFCIFALIDQVYDITYSQFFLRCVIIHIFLLISVGRRVVLNSISWFFMLNEHQKCFYRICACVKSDAKYVLQRLYTWVFCASTYLHLQKENLIPLFLHSAIQFWSGSTLMQECFKNIKWRDVDKKIRRWSFTFLET